MSGENWEIRWFMWCLTTSLKAPLTFQNRIFIWNYQRGDSAHTRLRGNFIAKLIKGSVWEGHQGWLGMEFGLGELRMWAPDPPWVRKGGGRGQIRVGLIWLISHDRGVSTMGRVEAGGGIIHCWLSDKHGIRRGSLMNPGKFHLMVDKRKGLKFA